MKRLLCILLSLSLFPLCCAADQQTNGGLEIATEYAWSGMYDDFETQPVTQTAATVEELSLSATSALLMEASTGRVLYEKNPDEQRAPASITKVMTLLLVMEAIEKGSVGLNHKVTASAHACSMGGSQIWLEEGETMTVDDLLKAVCVASANDAAVALGEHLDGSEEGFVAHMNRRARELGMTGTHFVNCCGLDAAGHVTTARDIAIMSRALIAHPLITQYSTIWMDTLRNGETELVNTNKLVRFYNGATGLKTGTTDDAGYCVAATAMRDGMELIAVVLDGATSDKRFSDAKAMLNYGFAKYTLISPDTEQLVLDPVQVVHGVTPSLQVTAEAAGPFLVEKAQGTDLTSKVVLSDRAEAPVAAGQMMGKVTYYCNGEAVGESRLLCTQEIPRMTWWRGMKRLFFQLMG